MDKLPVPVNGQDITTSGRSVAYSEQGAANPRTSATINVIGAFLAAVSTFGPSAPSAEKPETAPVTAAPVLTLAQRQEQEQANLARFMIATEDTVEGIAVPTLRPDICDDLQGTTSFDSCEQVVSLTRKSREALLNDPDNWSGDKGPDGSVRECWLQEGKVSETCEDIASAIRVFNSELYSISGQVRHTKMQEKIAAIQADPAAAKRNNAAREIRNNAYADNLDLLYNPERAEELAARRKEYLVDTGDSIEGITVWDIKPDLCTPLVETAQYANCQHKLQSLKAYRDAVLDSAGNAPGALQPNEITMPCGDIPLEQDSAFYRCLGVYTQLRDFKKLSTGTHFDIRMATDRKAGSAIIKRMDEMNQEMRKQISDRKLAPQ